MAYSTGFFGGRFAARDVGEGVAAGTESSQGFWDCAIESYTGRVGKDFKELDCDWATTASFRSNKVV
jgi:hypothetical protein